MGYEVHITRKDNWFDEEGSVITENEWRAYVATDEDLRITGVAEATTPKGETIRISSPLLTEWRRHSSGSTVWLSFHKGNLAIKNPDEECLVKMRQIAAVLSARVQGDDGEFYDLKLVQFASKKQPFLSRLGNVFRRWGTAKTVISQHECLPFGVGDLVRDTFGNEHEVIEIDTKAEHGLGVIRTRRADGAIMLHLMIAHGLCLVRQNYKGESKT